MVYVDLVDFIVFDKGDSLGGVYGSWSELEELREVERYSRNEGIGRGGIKKEKNKKTE
jgi:hypothetical protein